jgi:hypothetical protein
MFGGATRVLAGEEDVVCKNETYNWGPCEVLSQKHVLLLLCARHLVLYSSALLAEVALSQKFTFALLRRAEGVFTPGSAG